MNNQKGFIQIPILIAIIVGIIITGGAGYFGVEQYKNYQVQKIEREKLAQKDEELRQEKEKETQELAKTQQEALEKTQQEMERLKQEITQGTKELEQQISGGQEVIQQQKELEQKQKELEEKQKELEKKDDKPTLASIITQWRPRIAYIECDFRYTDGTLYATQSGSGLIAQWSDGSISILTNKHIVTDENGYGANTCRATFPDNSKVYEFITDYIRGIPVGISPNDDDWGMLTIEYPDNYIRNITSSIFILCDKPSLGDEVAILGYPTIGSQTGITITRGIISGYDSNYYITDAKIEHGNSGGAAISLKDNCYIGIPSYVIVGNLESLARILDSSVIWNSK